MNYKEIIQNVLRNGVAKEATRLDADGKPVAVENDTFGTFCEIFRHDMSKGFPLTTLRKMPWKSMCAELEMFIKGVTDKQFLKERNSKFWDYWCKTDETESYPSEDKRAAQREVKDLGPIGYSHGWRNFGGDYLPIPQIYSPYLDNIAKIDELIEHDSKSKHIGKTYKSNYGDFVVIKAYSTSGKNRRTFYDIMFKNTGYILKMVASSHIRRGNVKDVYAPKVFEVGCIGETAKKNDPLYSVWRNMIQRCYSKNAINYNTYGERGVRVCNRWLNASNFIEDVKKLPNWELKSEHPRLYSLDKDLLGNGLLYSPQTCCWLPEKDQKRNTRRNKVFKAIHDDGRVIVSNCATDFAKEHGLDSSGVCKAIMNPEAKIKGWRFEFIKHVKENKKGYDQLRVIVDKLKNSPYDRRMVCSAWNPNEMDLAALPSCHVLFNVVVYGNKLNLVWFQRSCDASHGIPNNIASYGLLLLLLCEESGLIPGELVGILSDCHLYNNTIESVKIMVEREEKTLPEVKIKRKPDGSFSIFDWTWDEVELTGYNPHDKIDMGAVTV